MWNQEALNWEKSHITYLGFLLGQQKMNPKCREILNQENSNQDSTAYSLQCIPWRRHWIEIHHTCVVVVFLCLISSLSTEYWVHTSSRWLPQHQCHTSFIPAHVKISTYKYKHFTVYITGKMLKCFKIIVFGNINCHVQI